MCIKKIFQSNDKLKKEIKQTGCAFLTCVRMAEIIGNFKLNVKEINVINELLITDKLIAKNQTIYNFQGCINYILRYYNIHDIQIEHIGNKTEYMPWTKGKPTHYTILIYNTPYTNVGGKHYMLGDKEGNVIYDPANGKVKTYDDEVGWLRFCVSGISKSKH